jgi:predicted nuclease of predicted toxin-antitoxin system
VKLLLDENLSPRLVRILAAEFPGVTHIELLGLRGAADRWFRQNLFGR